GRAAGLPAAPGAQSEDSPADREGRLRSAAIGTHARRAVLPVDVRDSLGPRSARARALRPRSLGGLVRARHGAVGPAGGPGSGPWGPPVRLGTRPELTLLRLVAVNGIG